MSTPNEPPIRAGIYVRKAEGWQSRGWSAVPNSLLRADYLSWDARGAYAWLASHQATFALRAEDLAAAGPKGRNHARDMLRELERHGWLTREKLRNPQTGRYDVHIYHLHPEPVPVERRTFVASTAQKRHNFAPRNPSSPPAPAHTGAGGELPPDPPETARSDPAPERAGAGRPGAGAPEPGRAGAYEKTTEEDPSLPPARRGAPAVKPSTDERPRCVHGRTSCRVCGTSPRARTQQERDAAVAERAERERFGLVCPMCIADGPAREGGTRWIRVLPGTQVPVTPYDLCDHFTPHPQRMRELADAEAKRVAPPQPEPTACSSPELRRQLVEQQRRRPSPQTSQTQTATAGSIGRHEPTRLGDTPPWQHVDTR